MVNKIFPTDITAKANPVDADILLIADSADNNELKQITIGSITADIGDGLIVDSSASTTTTYSSDKINTLNGTQDTTISGNYTTLNTNKLNRAAQLRTGNGTWKTTYNDGSGNEVELALGTVGTVLGSNGTASAPTWVAPSVSISGQTEDTAGDMDADFALVYDNSAGANRKQKINVFRATDAEVITGTSTTKFTTPANIGNLSPLRKIYKQVDSGAEATTSLVSMYTNTIPANTFTANSGMIIDCYFLIGGASSGDGTVNFKFGGTTVYTASAISLTGGANTPLHFEVRLDFRNTTGTCNLKVFRCGTSTITTTFSMGIASASLTSNQTFVIDTIRTGSGGSFAYYGSSMTKI